jgi:hypothetical protein
MQKSNHLHNNIRHVGQEFSKPDAIFDEYVYVGVSEYLEHVEHTESVLVQSLDGPITCHEIVNTVCKMKNNKSGGLDDLVMEMVKHSLTTLLPCSHALYNNILASSTCPDEWCKAVIFPLHKNVIFLCQITTEVFNYDCN